LHCSKPSNRGVSWYDFGLVFKVMIVTSDNPMLLRPAEAGERPSMPERDAKEADPGFFAKIAL
jgi:hypothetical protein